MTPKQATTIPILLTSANIKEAAAVAGISERTLYRWLHDPAFQAELQLAQDRIVNSAIRRMSTGISAAVDCLLQIINDPDVKASSRVNASRILLGEFRHLREFADLSQRVTALEVVINAKDVRTQA